MCVRKAERQLTNPTCFSAIFFKYPIRRSLLSLSCSLSRARWSSSAPRLCNLSRSSSSSAPSESDPDRQPEPDLARLNSGWSLLLSSPPSLPSPSPAAPPRSSARTLSTRIPTTPNPNLHSSPALHSWLRTRILSALLARMGSERSRERWKMSYVLRRCFWRCEGRPRPELEGKLEEEEEEGRSARSCF